MVKSFSVDWLAQSYHDSSPKQELENMERTTPAPYRPHIPCVVQPRPPTSYDKVYLQPKPKVVRTAQKDTELIEDKEASFIPPLHPRACSSPSFSENSGYSSGYESEAAASECPSIEEGTEGEREGSHRRIRTKFTPDQINKLEKIFSKHKYLDAGERVKTALKLNLSETQVRTWFQNRRMKLKREVQDLRTEYFAPTFSPMIFPPIPSVQYHCINGQGLTFGPAPHMPYPHMMPQIPVQQMISHPPSHPALSTPHYF
ncbi:ventral homeobox [Chanos chanos]|uniref:Ventral homeobox n=1 Tax=Chanos chanos TaxID=29144 RepID=A0A6J2V5A7_CHACN|nr:homeobox protein vent1-like [Chanos chanos]